LEALAKVDTVLLDKTGTLTFGTPQIRDVVSTDGFTERQIIAAAAIAERKSEHPLAKAIIARAGDLAIPVVEPDQFAYTPGKGVSADYRGEEIIVGSRTPLTERGVRMLHVNGDGIGGVSETYVGRGGQLLGPSASPMSCVPKRKAPLPRCGRWA
jgi:cation transport ATPase